MTTFAIENVELKGISCCVPKHIEHNRDLDLIPKEDIDKFIKSTGVEQRRIVDQNTCTSDLCCAAAEDLIKGLNWDKSEIDILVFVSQTADYILPMTSTILQDKLGLPKTCIAFDIPLGCSGYVYGMSIISSMMKSIKISKGLLLVGDTSSKTISKEDKSAWPLFGDAGSASAFKIEQDPAGIKFDLGSDGSGYQAIIIPSGGARNMPTPESYEIKTISEGIRRTSCQLVLEGMDVFSFGISQAPKTVNTLFEHFDINKESIDYYVFHQANMMMNKLISKKLKLPNEKVLYSLKEFGNTSSASIPLTLVSQLNINDIKEKINIMMCGFGVGLSWGTAVLELNENITLNLIEL